MGVNLILRSKAKLRWFLETEDNSPILYTLQLSILRILQIGWTDCTFSG